MKTLEQKYKDLLKSTRALKKTHMQCLKSLHSAESLEFAFNTMCQLFYDNHFPCNVVWCSPELKHIFDGLNTTSTKGVDIYVGDFGKTKIFSTHDVKWNQLKPKQIIAFIQE